MTGQKDDSERELRVVLKEDNFDKLNEIKKFHGLKSMAELVRFLITKEFRDIQERG